MYKLFFLFITCFSISANKPIITTYDLETALEKKIIECHFYGNTESPHYYQPLKVNIKNLTTNNIKIKINNGQVFKSDSTDVQDLIITKEELITFKPEEEHSLPLYAMCIQQNNSASNNTTTYSIGKIATGLLKKITKEIENKKSYNTIGLYSVWALTNNYKIEEIGGFDDNESIHYQNFISELLGVKSPIYKKETYKRYYNKTIKNKRSVIGKFEYKFHKQSHITIGLFNEQDIIVREIYNNPKEEPGKHLYKYAFDTETYKEPTYYIRLIANGKIKMNLKMEPRKRS